MFCKKLNLIMMIAIAAAGVVHSYNVYAGMAGDAYFYAGLGGDYTPNMNYILNKGGSSRERIDVRNKLGVSASADITYYMTNFLALNVGVRYKKNEFDTKKFMYFLNRTDQSKQANTNNDDAAETRKNDEKIVVVQLLPDQSAKHIVTQPDSTTIQNTGKTSSDDTVSITEENQLLIINDAPDLNDVLYSKSSDDASGKSAASKTALPLVTDTTGTVGTKPPAEITAYHTTSQASASFIAEIENKSNFVPFVKLGIGLHNVKIGEAGKLSVYYLAGGGLNVSLTKNMTASVVYLMSRGKKSDAISFTQHYDENGGSLTEKPRYIGTADKKLQEHSILFTIGLLI